MTESTKLKFNSLLFAPVYLWQKTRFLRSLFNFHNCRFYPSCSDYFISSVQIHGIIVGSFFSLKRFLKCNPCFKGGIDHVPHKAPDNKLSNSHKVFKIRGEYGS